MYVDTLLITCIYISKGITCMEIVIAILLLFFISIILWFFEYVFMSITWFLRVRSSFLFFMSSLIVAKLYNYWVL